MAATVWFAAQNIARSPNIPFSGAQQGGSAGGYGMYSSLHLELVLTSRQVVLQAVVTAHKAEHLRTMLVPSSPEATDRVLKADRATDRALTAPTLVLRATKRCVGLLS